MNPNYQRYPLTPHTDNEKYSTTFSQTDRPQTPVYLMQQSGADQYKKSLTENLTGYLTSSTNKKDSNELNNILLPKDVNYYFMETDKISRKVDAIFQAEKKEIEDMLDDYLKAILGIFEGKKNELFQILDSDHSNFNQFYQRFCESIQKFLDDSQNKLDRNMRSLPTSNSTFNDEFSNPLEFQISKLKQQRKQMESVENAILEVLDDYGHTSINEGKKVLEQMLIDSPVDQGSRKRTSVNRKILAGGFNNLIDLIARELKGLPMSEPEVKLTPKPEFQHLTPVTNQGRLLSPKVWEKLNPDKTGLMSNTIEQSKKLNMMISGGLMTQQNFRPSSCEPMMSKSIMNLNLENSMLSKVKKNVQFTLPTIKEERKQEENIRTSMSVVPGESNPMKSSSINININNVPYNNSSYVNIYSTGNNQHREQNSVYQKILNPKGIIGADAPDTKTKAFRPLSGNLRSSNFSFNPALKVNKEPEPPKIATPAVLSILKTNILSKSNSMSKSFKTNLLYNDYNSKISCFEVDQSTGSVVLGTTEGFLIINKIQFSGLQIEETNKISLNAPIVLLALVRSGLILAATDSTSNNLFSIDLKTGEIMTTFKTYKEKMKMVAYFENNNFLAVTGDDKLLLYECDKPVPKKSFKIPTPKLADICMASSKIIFTGSENGDIRIVKLNPDTETLSIEGSLKIEHTIISLEVFYNNEKLLLVNAQSKPENLIYIINTQTKKVMNIVKQSFNQNELYSYITITLYKKTPEIYLVSIGENQIAYCDIDDKAIDRVVAYEGGESFHLKNDLGLKGKLIKIMGYNPAGQIFAVGLCTSGIISFTFV